MAVDKLQYAIGNAASTTLASELLNNQTSAALSSETNFQAKSGEGMVIIDEGLSTEELAYSTGESGGSLALAIANRGLEGGSPQDHTAGATVKGILTATMWNNLIDALSLIVDKTTGLIKSGLEFVNPVFEDASNNELMILSGVATPVNEITISNAATNTNPSIAPTGSDSNIGINLTPKGTGMIVPTRLRPITLPKTVASDGATVTFDLSLSNVFEVILGGNRTLALSNIPTVTTANIKPILIRLIQDGTGSRTVTWFSTTDTVTMTIANPGVVTTTKDIKTGTPVIFTTTGALPTGCTAGTTYYWIRTGATTGNFATSKANAIAGTTVTTSGSQSGTHTMAVQILWGGGTIPTLTTGKYAIDEFGIQIIDSANGVIEGYTVGQDL